MGVLCLVRLLNVRGGRWMDLLMLVGVGAGLAASVWSQTRGGWVAMLLIMGWMLHKATQNWGIAKRVLIAGAMLAALAIPVLLPNGIVQNRVMAAITEFEGYLESNTQDTSVGARLAMWEFAYKDLAVAPLIGRGAEGWKQSRDAGIKSGSLDPFLRDFSHLHNEFLDALYKNGLIGLSLLLTLYWVPMLIFFKPYLHGYGSEAKALAMGGMVLPMMFIDYGLTQTFLSHNSGRMVFVSMMMCLGGLVLNTAEDNKAYDAV
jgi:O-antigen ligase